MLTAIQSTRPRTTLSFLHFSSTFRSSLILAILFAIAALASYDVARAEDFATLASPHSYEIKLEDGRLAGEGGARLVAEAQRAQFVVIGENHGVAEVPEVVAALFRRLRTVGYEYLAIETGPFTAERLESLAREENSREAFRKFFSTHPSSVPFYTTTEELALLETVTALTAPGSIWGIDQEFLLSPGFLLGEMKRDAATATIEILDELIDREKFALGRLFEHGDPSGTFMMAAKDRDLEALRSSLEGSGSSRALQILDELEASRAIYTLNFRGRAYENNFIRAEHNKGLFIDAYDRATVTEASKPRVVIKMGGMHCGRGRNALDVLDIGNLTCQLATIERTSSLHLLIVSAGGTQNLYVPMRGEGSKRSPVQANSTLMALRSTIEGESWRLVDLRPLRPRATGLSAAERSLIFEYDFLFLIPEGRAATTLESRG